MIGIADTDKIDDGIISACKWSGGHTNQRPPTFVGLQAARGAARFYAATGSCGGSFAPVISATASDIV